MAGSRIAAGAALLMMSIALPAAAQQTVKIGVITPLTGPFAATGLETVAAMTAYMQEHGDTVAGKKIELIVKDDGGVPDTTKRLAQELVVNDHVSVLAGMGLTPLALAVAPIATQAKVPEIVTSAATSSIPSASPYILRTSYAVPQPISVIADWTFKNGIKTVVTLVSDYGPGIDSETWFKGPFEKAGGKVLETLRVPLLNPDFAPFLQRAADAHPEGIFVFVPAGIGAAFMRQYTERGLDKSGVKLIAAGDVTDDQVLNDQGEPTMGLVTAFHYSAAHESAENRRFVADVAKAGNGIRANFMAVGAYDGLALVYKALEKTGGDTDGTKLVEAMKGMSWESPRGPITIDPETRDIVQNIYLRKVDKQNGQYWNAEFQIYPAVKDPAKTQGR